MTEYLLVYDRLLSNDECDKIKTLMSVSSLKRIKSSDEFSEVLNSIFEFLDIISLPHTSEFIEIATNHPATFLMLDSNIEPAAIMTADEEFWETLSPIANLIDDFRILEAEVRNLSERLSTYSYSYRECFEEDPQLDDESAFDEFEQHILNEEEQIKSEIISALKKYKIK